MTTAGPVSRSNALNCGLLGLFFFACLLVPCRVYGDMNSDGFLFVANQLEHTVLLVDPISKQVLAKVGVDINGHEVAVFADGHLGYVPIYGNAFLGTIGSNVDAVLF